MFSNRIFRSILVLALGFLVSVFAYASDMTSPNFIIRDPIIGTLGGYGTSANFQLISSGDTILTGANISSTFIGREGFLYYPFTTTTPPVSGGGGGGGGGPIVYQSGVKFSGSAYPNAIVVVLKGLSKVSSVTADNTGSFAISIPENDQQLFTIFATDVSGRQSTLLNFPTAFRTGYLTDITGIRFAPTIMTDKITVKKGDSLIIDGASLLGSTLEIAIEGSEFARFSLQSDTSGSYRATIPIDLKEGEYIAKVRYAGDGRWSKVIKFAVGSVNIFQNEGKSNIPGDCNADQNVTLSDFSILAYWFGKDNPPKCVDTNNDGTINLIDFSILAFYWNG